jgi:ribonuclease-3
VQEDLKELEAVLDHEFSNPELLVRALTHRSLAHQLAQADQSKQSTPVDNERLEFLGDAVLGLVVAEDLFVLHPEWQEGAGLGKHLRLNRSEEHSGLRRKSTVLSNTMEAVMGALFLDGGLDPVRTFVRRRVMGETTEQLAFDLRSGAALGNYKSALQERLQAARAGKPVYRIKRESGPGHSRRFLVEVRLKGEDTGPGRPLARGIGRSKKAAEQDAARRALEHLENLQGLVSLDSTQSAEAAATPDIEPGCEEQERPS